MTDATADDSRADRTLPDDPAALSRDLLAAVRRGDPTDRYRDALAALDDGALAPLRDDRPTALAFWLNAYNAAAQLLLADRPALYDSRWRFFRANALTVGGVPLSLDDVEHGVLRGERSKYGLGYLPRLDRCGLGAAYRLDADPRVHFALNCGAASCPVVRPFAPETVDDELDAASRAHLDATVEYDADADTVRVPRFCLWFVGDFGGPSGVRAFLREYDQIPETASPSLRFHGYDWAEAPRKFATEE